MSNALLAALWLACATPALGEAVPHEALWGSDPLARQIELQRSRGDEPQTVVAVRGQNGRRIAVALLNPSAGSAPLSGPAKPGASRAPAALARLRPSGGLKAARPRSGRKSLKPAKKQLQGIAGRTNDWEKY